MRKICPTCKRIYTVLSNYCTKCGIELVKEPNRCSEMKTAMCKNRIYQDDDIYCEYCGAPTRLLNQKAMETGCEYAQVVSQDKYFDLVGGEYEDKVRIDLNQYPGKNLKLWHSRSNITPLSAKDLAFLVDERVASVGNVSINGDVFIVEVGNGYRPTAEDFDAVSGQIEKEVDIDIIEMEGFQNWTPEERNYVAIREQFFRASRHFGWNAMAGDINE